MLAIFAWFKQPILYFFYEIIVLNVLLLGLVVYEHWTENRIATHGAAR